MAVASDIHTARITAVAFSPTAPLLASVCSKGLLALTSTPSTLAASASEKAITAAAATSSVSAGTALCSAAWSPDGSEVVVGDAAGNVVCVSAPGLSPLRKWKAHGDSVSSVVYVPGGRRIATSSCKAFDDGPGSDPSVRIWDVATSACLQVLYPSLQPHHSIAVSPDGTQLLAASRTLPCILAPLSLDSQVGSNAQWPLQARAGYAGRGASHVINAHAGSTCWVSFHGGGEERPARPEEGRH